MLAPIASESPSADNGVISVPLRERSGAIADAVRRLDDAGLTHRRHRGAAPTLDDVFLRLTGHAVEQEEEPAEVERR